jgi:cell wall-associated NlpC family hydrolase
MVGVQGGRICAFYTNSDTFDFDGIKSGDDKSAAAKYEGMDEYRIYADASGKIDSIMYNQRSVASSSDSEIIAAKNMELLDMINSYRARHNYSVYVFDEDITNAAWTEAIGFMGGVDSDSAVTVKGYDIFSVYRQLIEAQDPVLSDVPNKSVAVGVSTPVSERDHSTYAAILVKENKKAKREITYVDGFETDKTYDEADDEDTSAANTVFADETDEVPENTAEPEPVVAPEICNIDEILKYESGSDIILDLGETASGKYHVQVLDVENEKYILNSYITTTDSHIVIPSKSLVPGADYKISLTAIDADGASVGRESETLITYGDAGDGSLDIIGPVSNVAPPNFGLLVDEASANASQEPENQTTVGEGAANTPSPMPTETPEPTAEPTPVPEDAPEFLKEGFQMDEEDCVYIDTDYIPLQWQSSVYHEFSIDLYNSDGELVANQIVEDENSAIIRGVDPGTYYVYVTALSRGTFIEKAQDMIRVTVVMPEPVVNEIILDKDDKYYFVYEDEALGVLYFYDEEIVDVEENGETVKKKKIIQKQVKSTKAYRELAKYRSNIEYVTGDPVKTVVTANSATGNAIVEEAKKYLGIPYVWGGTTPAGFDCSGLVQYVFSNLGINVSRVTYDQVKDGIAVNRDDLQPGDLVFFGEIGSPHHVGIYIGNDEFIHAPHTGDVVKISSLKESYYAGAYSEARRVY